MLAVCLLTLRRLKEPASVILLLLGCLLSFFVHGTETFEISNVHGTTANGLVGGNRVLMGTILLVGLGALISIFNGATEIPRDISSRVIFLLLSKPLSRLEYVYGKFLGILIIGLGSAAVWITLMLLCRAALTNTPLTLGQVLAQYACALMLVPITALAICASCCFGDIVSMIVTVSYLLLSFAIVILPVIAALSALSTSTVVLAIYFFFPNLSLFLQSYTSVWANAALVAYAFAAATILLLLGRGVFERGDVQ